MGQVLQRLQLLAVSVREIVQPMALAVTAGDDPQAAVLPRRVHQVVGKEDARRPRRGRPRAVPLHEVLMPIERRAVRRLGQDDHHLIGAQLLQSERAAGGRLRRQADDPFRPGIAEPARISLALPPPLRRHGSPPAPGVREQIAALVADQVAHVSAGEDGVRPRAQLLHHRRRHYPRNRGVAARYQLISLAERFRCRKGHSRYIPQTVTGAPAPAGARRKILSAQVRFGARSNTIRWPASAPQRSM